MEGTIGLMMTVSPPTLSFDQVVDRLVSLNKSWHENYLAMYSSWLGGIVKEPALMMVPLDDHLVHRGDGVFEAFKCVDGNVYGLGRHLDRMERSARTSGLSFPVDRSRLEGIILETIRAAAVPDCLIRVYLSRGPGGFSTNPYECPESQLYIMVTTLSVPPQEKYSDGVRLVTSLVPMKRDYFANIKSCNYLPNVLMTKEARDKGVEFTVSLDEKGFLGEGATENVGIITREREFLVPRFDRILKGVTVSRMLELAGQLAAKGGLNDAREADISREDAYRAHEMMVFGTTFDILPVVTFDDRPIGNGKPGQFFENFLALLRQDMSNGSGMVTRV